MVFNVLWLSAVAAAAMLAGFCMGRLSVRAEGTLDEENQKDGRVQRKNGWEMETAGEVNVRVDKVEWATGGESRGIRKAERFGSEETAERTQDNAGKMQMQTIFRRHAGERMRLGTVERLTNAARAAINSNSRRMRSVRTFPARRTSQAPEGKTWTVGSPVSGYVSSYQEGEHPAVVVCPAEDRLYAPIAGKIIRLFPMGNAFLFRTEFGAELYIQAGEVNDDLLGRYFRPRVVQNEIVSKGKLLLEFDRQGLVMEGASALVTVRVESRAYGSNVVLAADEKVSPGEELLRVTERSEPDSGRLI